MKLNWIDRAMAPIAPRWTMKRIRARMSMDVALRNYEAASVGRRTQGWQKSGADANAAIGPALSVLRMTARDLVRNNPYAESALSTIVDHAVGWGIVAKSDNERCNRAFTKWADSTDCDADGRHDLYGLQKLVMRTTVESGEVLIRRRLRRPSDGFALPLQLQVLDPDFLDTTKDTAIFQAGSGGKRIIQGVEYDSIGRRVAYWLFKEHPGSNMPGSMESDRVPASEIIHHFRAMRPGQVRGPSWFAPVLLRFKDFDEFEDATLVKQKIAACLSVLTTDVDGSNAPLGSVTTSSPLIDMLEPGMIANLPPGKEVKVVDPPQAGDYDSYSKTVLRAIATGLGVTYEDLTGDYADMPFSAARMSRIRHWARVEDWRWRMLIPQFCDPVWNWAMEAAAVMSLAPAPWPQPSWTAPPAPMIDPSSEGLAYMRNVRAGIMSLSEALRERGYDPKAVLEEMKSDMDMLDKLGLILDSDPRNMTQAGQLQGKAAADAKPEAPQQFEDERRLQAVWPKR